MALLTQHAMGQPTYVLYDPHDGEGFVQVRYRAHQAAADVTYLAPSLTSSHRVSNTWFYLLDGACIEAAGRGIQRVFASLAESSAEVDIFHQAGFTLYAGEVVYRLAQPEIHQQGDSSLPLRRLRPEDWPAVQKLCVAVTPQRVRQAEGGITLAMGQEKNCQRFVLPGENDNELAAVLSICIGETGHWLRVLIHPEAGTLTEALVREGLAVLDDHPVRPAYCNVRQYEAGIQTGLEAAGFEHFDTRVLMVKHTVAWIKTPVQELAPALKGRAEPVPPAYRIDGKPKLET
ncbi:MAG: hypothetical protein PVH17_03495 [Anaerolineae bacterium]